MATETVLRMIEEGGSHHVPHDTGSGGLNRPFAVGDRGGRTATLETLYDFFINAVPDPDTAMEQDPNFDEKMRQHPVVHACMRLRELTVASMPAHIEPSKAKGIDQDTAQNIADYVEDVFNTLSNRADLYRQMQLAVLAGGQGHEFIWRRVDGHDRPVAFFPVHKSRFMFDRLGNMALLTRETPVWGSYVDINPTIFPNGDKAFKAPQGKFMYHKYMSEGGPFYRPAAEGYVYWGRGEDVQLYIPVTFDQFVLRFRMKWLEKFGMPPSVLYYPDSEGVSSQVRQIAESIRGESVIAIPRPTGTGTQNDFYDLDFQTVPTAGVDAFTNFSENWTRPNIEKILLGGANLLDVSSGGYAATTGQRDAGADIIFRYDARNIDETINIQLIPHIVNARWPGCPPKYYPKHLLAPKEDLDQEVRLNNLQLAAQMVPIPEKAVYDAANVDRPKKGEKGEEDEPFVFLGQQGQPGGEPGAFDGFPPINPPKGGGKPTPGKPPPAKPPGGNKAPHQSRKRPRSPIGKRKER